MREGFAPHLALLFVQIFFGTLPVMGKVVLRVLEPGALVGFRIVGGALLLELARRLMKAPMVAEPGVWKRLALLALLGISANQVLYLEGLARTTAINAAVLTTCIPVLTASFAILLRQERFHPLKAVGILLSLLGALRVIGVEGLELSSRYLVGNLLVFGNTVVYSLYLVLARELLARHGALSVIAPVFAFGALGVMPLVLPAWGRIEPEGVPVMIWALSAAIVIFPTVLAYVLNIWALKHTRPSVVTVYIYLQPVITAALGMGLLGERLTAELVQAAVLAFLGVFLVSRARTQEH